MPVTFVIGRAGSGKTVRCLDRLAREAAANPLGPPLWLVVPKQATFEAERALVGRLGAFVRVRVVHPEQLGEDVLAEVGGVAVPRVTAAGRRMVIGRLLYQHHDELTYFASSARRPGLAASIDALFDEFERSGQTLDELGDLIDTLARAGEPADDGTSAPAAPPALHAKLADLRLLYTKYAAYVGQDRLDPHRRREEVLKKLGQSDLLRHAAVYVDGFYDFTDAERRMLATLAAGPATVEVNLTMPPESPVVTGVARLPDELSPFHRTERAYLRLLHAMAEAGAAVTDPVFLDTPRRFEAEPLQRIERLLFAPFNAPPPAEVPPAAETDSSPVVFFEAPDPRVEVRAVARRVRDLLAAGYRQREVLVLCRSLDDYAHLVHTAFAEHGLAYFADRRRPATHHPLVRMLRAAVRVAREGFSTAAVTTLTKSGLVGLTQGESDALENYLVEHRVTAVGWLMDGGWAFARRSASADEEFDVPPPPADAGPRDVNALRAHLRDRLLPLYGRLGRHVRETAPLRELVAELVATLERFGVRGTLSEWIGQDRDRDPEQAEEHEGVWRQLVELFEQMVEVLGDQRVSAGEFVEVLESGLDAFDLAIAPPTVDQVLVGSVDRTRPPATVRAVFVLGLARGVFPPAHRDESLLSGPERRELGRHRIDVEPDAARRQIDERFLAYVAFTRGSHKLVVSRPRADEAGRELEPSEFWADLRAVVPEAPVAFEQATRGGGPGGLSTPRDVVGALLGWARGMMEGEGERGGGGEGEGVGSGGVVEPADDAWQWQLYDWVARRPATAGTEVDRLIDRAWPALCYGNTASLSPAVAGRLFPAPLVVSAGQLEAMAACPFQHFVAYGLRLGTRGGGDISAMDLSQVYHGTLEELVRESLARKQAFADLPPEELSKLAKLHAPEIARQLRGQVMLDEARNAYLLDRVARTLDMILGTVREQLGRGRFTPFYAGATFGPDAKIKPPDITANGTPVHLRGRIDRVDRAPDGSLAVYDYRMGDHKLSAASVYHGLSLRLLTCLLVLDRAKLTYQGKALVPAAALCARLLRPLQKADHPSKATDPATAEFRLSAKPRGVVRATHVGHFDRETTTGASPVIAFWVNKDGTFGRRDWSDVCEADEFGALVDFVGHKVAELAGQVVGGRVAVEPYLYNDTTPCVRCGYRKICRFEPGINRYRKLESLPRKAAIDEMRAAVGRGS